MAAPPFLPSNAFDDDTVRKGFIVEHGLDAYYRALARTAPRLTADQIETLRPLLAPPSSIAAPSGQRCA